MARRKFDELRKAMPQAAQDRAEERTRQMLAQMDKWGQFTLAELQLLKLGLEVIGEELRVDHALVPAHMQLRQSLGGELLTRFPDERLSSPGAPQEGK